MAVTTETHGRVLVAVSATLGALEEQRAADEEAGWAATRRAEDRIAAGPDKQEGLDAFAAKRAPRWSDPPA